MFTIKTLSHLTAARIDAYGRKGYRAVSVRYTADGMGAFITFTR